MSKSPEMIAALDKMSLSMYGRSRSESIAAKVCVACGVSADKFDDLISRREYQISGLCQKCQDDSFAD